MGLPFLAVRGLLHSDILTYRPDLLIQENPFNPGEHVVVAQPIRPDVAVFHALKADREGNVLLEGILGVQKEAVLAAKRSLVTVEEVVDDYDFQASLIRVALPVGAAEGQRAPRQLPIKQVTIGSYGR